jgi:hypothetical protein
MKLPCIDCICLPICQSYYLNNLHTTTDWFIRIDLEKKCEILYNYNLNLNIKKINYFHSFMKKPLYNG